MYACARRHAADHTIMRSVALIRAAHCLILCINRTKMIVIYMHIIEITSFSVLEQTARILTCLHYPTYSDSNVSLYDMFSF